MSNYLQSLRGPRGGMIFFRKDPVLGVDLESAINNAVFPGLQVGLTSLVVACREEFIVSLDIFSLVLKYWQFYG